MNSGFSRAFSLLLVAFALIGSRSVGSEPAPISQGAGKAVKPNVTELAPHVRLDWSSRTVEIEAEVVLREGPLELFVCTPGTREHESILVTSATPTHVYQALGLIGLTHGRPVYYDEEKKQAISATGDAVEVLIRFGDQDRRRIVPAANWLADSESGKPIDKVRWVFAGSHRIDKTTLGAELDGTMICVVDFESALIAVDSLHTSENESLWLNAHTKAIPPVGTKCTILIRAANADTAVIATLLSDRSYLVGNQRVSEEQFVAICISKIKGNSKTKIMLNQDDAVSPETINEAIESLVKLGISRHSIVAPEPLKEKPLNADPLKKGKAGAEGDKG